MGLFPLVDSYQTSVTKNYNKKIQVQKNYNIHNNISVNPSPNLTQNMCVNPSIVKSHWKYCLRKEIMVVTFIIV